MPRTGLSAVIVAFNEADRIADCLSSASFCDELLVVDSCSTDGTREVAAASGARVIEQPWLGFCSQKDFAVRAARHDWVLCLDADERVSPDLRAEIEALRERGFPGPATWSMPRRNWYFGRFLRHGLLYPDRVLRLFDRRRARYAGREIHERVEGEGPVGKLRGALDHYSYRSLAEHEQKLRKYAGLMAAEMHAQGRRAGPLTIVVRTAWRFLSGYVLRLGFLDGWRGLLVAWIEARYVAQKYAALWRMGRGAMS